MAITEKLQILITADGRAAQQEFNKLGASAEKNIGKTDDRLKQMSGQMVAFGATAVVAGGVAAAGLYKLAQAAGDLSESQNKANVVLGTEGAKALEEFANGAATAAGLSKRAATDAGASFAVFGKSAGLSGQGLADFSIQLTQLAGDLASFSNTTPEEAIVAIGAALRGESEPIRKYGVLLDDATLKAKALELGIYSGTGTLTQQQRVLAAQAEILKQTTDAQGDFGRTSEGLANQQRILSAEFENTKAAIGEALLPAFQAIVGGLSDVTGAFNGLPDGTKKAIGGVAGVGTAAVITAGGLALAAGGTIKAVTAMQELAGASRILSTTLKGGIPLAIAFGLTEVASGIINDITGSTDRLNAAMTDLGTNLDKQAPALRDFFAAADENVFSANPFTLVRQLFEDVARGSATLADGTTVDFRNIERVINDTAASGSGALQQLEDQLEAERAGLNKSSQAYEDYGTILDIINAKQAEFKTPDLGRSTGAAIAGVNLDIKGTGEAADGSAGSVDEYGNAVDDAKAAADDLKASLAKLAFAQKLSSLEFDKGAKRASAFGDSIEQSTSSDNLLKSSVSAGKALRGLREQLGLIPKEADAAKEATDEAQKTIDRLTDAAAAADPAVSDLGITMDAAAAGADAFNKSLASASGFGSQLDAAVDLGEAFDNLHKSARRLPKSIDLTAIALGELKPRQQDAIRDLRALGSATTDYLTALLKSGASADEVRNQAAGFRAELEKQLRAAGLSEEAIKQYTEAALLAPSQIETAIKLSGTEQARFKLDAYLSLLQGKIPPEVATSVIAQIDSGDLEGAASTLKDFSKTNPVDIDFTPKGTDKLDEAVGKITDLPKKYDPLVAATGGYTDANYKALDAVLGLGDAYKDTLSQLASDDPKKAVDWAARMRDEFAKTVGGLGLTEDELNDYYTLLGIAPDQVDTAVKISIDAGEYFALTTTIDLLQSVDGLSPEVTVQLAAAINQGDYEAAQAILTQQVDVQLGVDPLIGEETYSKITERWKSEQHDTKLGADTAPARTAAGELYGDVERLHPTITVEAKLGPSWDSTFSKISERYKGGPGYGTGSTGGVVGIDPNPGGGVDGNIWTPFAKGGRFAAGTQALVGEQGPELVTFGAAGSVLPAGPTSQLMQPTSIGSDKGQAALLDALRQLAANMPDSGDQIVVHGAVDPIATAEEIVRTKRANKYLAGRS